MASLPPSSSHPGAWKDSFPWPAHAAWLGGRATRSSVCWENARSRRDTPPTIWTRTPRPCHPDDRGLQYLPDQQPHPDRIPHPPRETVHGALDSPRGRHRTPRAPPNSTMPSSSSENERRGSAKHADRRRGYMPGLMTVPDLDAPAAQLRLAILPSGALLVDEACAADDTKDGLSGAARARVGAAFSRGPGHGLLDLGTTELDASLSPPLMFLREIGRAFATRLRAAPDLEERRERVEVDCPPDERARLASAVPPMPGAEYVDSDWIAARWAEIGNAFAEEIPAHRGTVAEWLRARHPSWHVVGKVCLHLAENRGDDEHPFAFLATYAVRAGTGGKVQHRPLARALEESSARGDRQALLQLLVPLRRAAEQSEWLAEMIDSGAIYQPLAWTPADAHRFLHAVPAFEAAGLIVRVPDWWRARRPPRPQVTVRVGEKKPSAVGMDALLDFSVAVALGDEKLTAAEVRQLLASSSGGLVRLRGQWVELDRERLREALAHWE